MNLSERCLDAGSHLGDGQTGSVGSENGVRQGRSCQILEQILLQIHALQKDNFHDEVSVRQRPCGQPRSWGSEQLVNRSAVILPFFTRNS